MGSGADKTYIKEDIKPNRISVEDNYNDRVLTIDGTYGDYDDVTYMFKTILEFLGYNSEGVCEQIAENQRSM